MPINRPEIKGRARELMRTVRPSVFLATLITLAVCWILSLLSSRVSGVAALNTLLQAAQDSAQVEQSFTNFAANPRPAGTVLAMILGLMSSIWSTGLTVFCLRATRGKPVSYANLMDGFTVFLRLLILLILQSVLIFLWSLLLIIPGIIAGYRYSQAIYLLLDRPELSPLECIRESARLMKGHKMELFVLNLSFIGWMLLTIIPLVNIYVLPYMQLTFAEYYNRLIGWVPPAIPLSEQEEDDRIV